MSNILITGGAGFIGSHLADALLAQNHRVIIIDNLSTGSFDNLSDKAIFRQYDITDPLLSDLFDAYRFDYVFHLAAQINLRHSIKFPQIDAKTNILGSLNVLENCVRTKVKQVIFASTGGAIYSINHSLPWNENTPTDPLSPYGLAKQTVENYLHFFHCQHGLQYTILRLANVYGSRQLTQSEAGVISIFVEQALANEPLTIFGDGAATRDFIEVSDVVNAFIFVMKKKLTDCFNVSSKTQISIKELAEQILTLTGSKSKIQYKDAIPGEIKDTCLDASKLKEFGWRNKVSLNEGLQKVLNWYKA
jgi:UDP-glucose 4-epimerase